MGTKPLCGVNLGGWLVLEKWITPSLFRGTKAEDEYTYCQQAGTAELRRLKEFRDTFITREDFLWLQAQGIQAVRLPVGYWVFGGEPPYAGTVEYMDKAFKWAEETKLKVLLDLHGAKGSQNGRDHSGRLGKTQWHRDNRNMAHTRQAVKRLAERYHASPALLGVSLMNEPSPVLPRDVLEGFYRDAYNIVREVCGPDTWVVYSDGYLPSRWRRALLLPDYTNVLVDTHHYQTFTPLDKLLPPHLNVLRTRWQLPWKLRRLARYHPVIVGEWSLTFPEEQLRKLSPDQRAQAAKAFATAQLQAYRKTAAWFFWTYKTEAGGTWSFRDCTEKGLLSP